MSVEYHASGVTNMDMDDCKIAYKQFFGDGSPIHKSVYALRNNPFKVATVCLGLLSILLVAAVIGQGVYYQNVKQDDDHKLQAMIKEKETVQQNLKTLQEDKKAVEADRDRFKQSNDYFSKIKQQIQTNNNLLKEEVAQLKGTNSQLQTSNAALNKQIQQLNTTNSQLQTNINALTTQKTLLQNQYNALVKIRDELKASHSSVTKERDNLQNKFNNVTRSRERLQLSYNELIQKVEHWQDKLNFTTSEKDKIESSHRNLTIAKDTLQASYDIVKKAEDELQASYTALVKEKNDLESSFRNVTAERNMLKSKNNNLTTERDQLLEQITILNATLKAKTCPSGWRKFQNSCYFSSASKKTWKLSRDYCQSKGADLAIVKSPEEMSFLNGMVGGGKEVWIGLTDEGVEGHWKWVDGTDLTISYWGSGQPNSYSGRNQDCVEFRQRSTGNGDWNDEDCTATQNWICEM
ncbi:CD209 antigen-like isoform X2 [Mugil cephalus]|uniref:CD209 antigen-like isoform X2 n=1 Tax=Mugil cephalus TaxID=48193 RepID=UPI001FB7B2F2|nr:CD209 antigen-like isoform X2 [Mugil cephalus]